MTKEKAETLAHDMTLVIRGIRAGGDTKAQLLMVAETVREVLWHLDSYRVDSKTGKMVGSTID